jgi:protein SCO1/2
MYEIQRSLLARLLGFVFGAALLAAALAAAPAAGHDGTEHEEAVAQAAPTPHAQHGAHQGHDAPPPLPDVKVRIVDVDVVDRNGKVMRFREDALGDRIVALDFIYTTCTTACPVLSSTVALVQEELGDRLDNEVRLITISIDPARDTPARMRKWAEIFDAGPDWLWLTGKKPEIDRLLQGLGAYTPDVESHPPMFIIGDPANDRWTRLFGFVAPEEILAQIEAMRAARGAGASSNY